MTEAAQPQDPREVAAYFDRCAREGVMASFEPGQEVQIRALLDRWALRPGQRVLEPGCGAGRLTERLAGAVGPTGLVYAFDLSPEMMIRARARGLGPHAAFAVGDATRIERKDGDFDACVCFHVFPHFADKARALGEIARVLKPGGALWVNHLKGREALNAFHRSVAPEVASHQLPPDGEMRALLAAAGFRDVLISDGESGYSLGARRG